MDKDGEEQLGVVFRGPFDLTAGAGSHLDADDETAGVSTLNSKVVSLAGLEKLIVEGAR